MRTLRSRLLAGLFSAMTAAVALAPSAHAAGSATTTLSVTLTIAAGCNVAASAVAFPTSAVISAPLNAAGSVTATCTNTTPYTVALDQGAGSGATLAARKMTGPASATVTYALYQDSGRSTLWGTTGAALLSGTGNGSAQVLPVYGQAPAQTTPAPGAYSDIVNVTVSF